MQPSTKALLAIAVLLVISGGAYLFTQRAAGPALPPPVPPPPSNESEEQFPDSSARESVFEDRERGVSFAYRSGPDGYTPVEAPGEPSILRFVTLYATQEWEELQNATDAREGPPGISYAAIEAPDAATAKEWVETASESNYQLMGKPVGEVTVGGQPGFRYSYDGLYGSQAVAVVKNGIAHVFSVSYIDPADPIVRDFETLLSTVEFSSSLQTGSL